jgi:hypothetical protein
MQVPGVFRGRGNCGKNREIPGCPSRDPFCQLFRHNQPGPGTGSRDPGPEGPGPGPHFRKKADITFTPRPLPVYHQEYLTIVYVSGPG